MKVVYLKCANLIFRLYFPKDNKLLKLSFGSKFEILNLPNLCLLLFVLQCFSFRLSFFIYARNNTFKSSRKIKYGNIDKSIQLILLNIRKIRYINIGEIIQLNINIYYSLRYILKDINLKNFSFAFRSNFLRSFNKQNILHPCIFEKIFTDFQIIAEEVEEYTFKGYLRYKIILCHKAALDV